MKNFLLIISIPFIVGLLNIKTKQTLHEKASELDSLKEALQIKDSIVILTKSYDKYTKKNAFVFIDYNRQSTFHKNLKDFFIKSSYDTSFYKSRISNQMSSDYKKPNIPKNLINKWIPLYKYKNKFYVYQSCLFPMMYEVNDSTFISYYMDGGDPSLIQRTDIQKNSITLYTNTKNYYKFDNIDSKMEIYILTIENECYYYTSINNINKFDIIVQTCLQAYDDALIEFDKIQCK